MAKANPFRFSSKFTDDESGLIYYGHRYFSPELGRFINRDPSEEQGGANLYSFCGNNGVSAWDRLGLGWP
jgi:RHS repeat-associated protein